eukprot:g44178.t1
MDFNPEKCQVVYFRRTNKQNKGVHDEGSDVTILGHPFPQTAKGCSRTLEAKLDFFINSCFGQQDTPKKTVGWGVIDTVEMDFDIIIPRIGGFGRYHKRLAAAACLPNLLLAFSFFSDVFLSRTPDHYCRPDPQLLPLALRNLSGSVLNYSLPLRSGSEPFPASWSRCRLHRYPLTAGTSPPLPNGTVSCTRGWQFQPRDGLDNNVVSQ